VDYRLRCEPRGRTNNFFHFHFFPPGTGVDYRALRASGEFAEYVALSGQLSRVDPLAMTRYGACRGGEREKRRVKCVGSKSKMLASLDELWRECGGARGKYS